VVKQLHREFVRAGSDIVEAFTYYGHREKMRLIGKEDLLEPLNRDALRLAREVAEETEGERPLVAGNICNTNIYGADDADSHKSARGIFEEQVGWAVDAGVDLIIAETFGWQGEAEIALDVMKQSGLPSVVTLTAHKDETLRDGDTAETGCKKLEDLGADVVGVNCARGPDTMLPIARRVRAAVSCHVAALPVPYRTRPANPTFQSLHDHDCGCIPGDRAFPVALDPFTCNRYEIGEFAREAYEAGIRYLGVCCGNAPHHTRQMAEALGRHPPASAFSADMSKHYAFGTDESLLKENQEYSGQL
jgi:betaine-homocysteine S-methyltransferase